MTLEEISTMLVDAIVRRDDQFVQSAEAIEAATAALRETAEADVAVSDAIEAVEAMQELAASFSPTSSADDFAELMASFQDVASTRDLQLVEVGQATAAVTAKIKEAAEAELSDAEYKAAIAKVKEAMAEYK